MSSLSCAPPQEVPGRVIWGWAIPQRMDAVKIADLRRGMRRITVEGVVQRMGKVVEMPVPDREPARHVDIVLADDSGEITATLWNYDMDGVREGSRLRIEGANASVYRGVLRLGVDFAGRVIIL